MLYYKKTGETSSFCFILCPIPRIIPHYSHKKQVVQKTPEDYVVVVVVVVVVVAAVVAVVDARMELIHYH